MFSDQDEAEWADAGKEKKKSATLLEGDYQGSLEKAKIFVSRDDGSKKLILVFSITSPADYFGSEYSMFLGLETSGQKYFTKKAMVKMGMNTDIRLSEIVDECANHYGKKINFRLVKNGNYLNGEILGVVDMNSDIPF